MLLLGVIEVPIWVILTLFIIITIYWYGTRTFNYWTKLGVPGPPPIPCVGTLFSVPSIDLYDMDTLLQKKYGKTIGLYTTTSPELMIFDEDMITEVTIKQFHNFTDHRPNIFYGEKVDSNLLNLRGETWKLVRSVMSPTFTTGKLRKMSDEINRSAKSFVDRLISTEGAFEAKELSHNFMMDCIASTAFGLRVDSQKDENNEFNVYGKRFLDFSFTGPGFLTTMLAPELVVKILNFLGVPLGMFDTQAVKFFADVIEKTLEGRARGGKERNDFIQLMANAQKGEDIRDGDEGEVEDKLNSRAKRGLMKDEVVANALLFFLAGFDTVTIILVHVMYNLACHQDCQQKLIEEIDSIIGDTENITYDASMKMPYLDQCLNETLRMFPPAFRLDRRAVCDVDICGLRIKKGVIINIPVLAIHMDPNIWPEPKKFDPERFSPEKKASIKPTQFMPFGIGPRNCIGMRQAQFEIKVAIAQLLKTHKLVTCEKSEIPLKLSMKKMMNPVNGAWLAVEKRA